MLDLAVLPSGRLTLLELDGDSAPLPDDLDGPLKAAFADGPGEGILLLATRAQRALLPPAFAFWRRFGEGYLAELCHIPETTEDSINPLPPPGELLERLAESAPPMRGGEYLCAEAYAETWLALGESVRKAIPSKPGSLAEWLQRHNPLWHRVGRVCFHLAENKNDPEAPFAFLATYASKLIDGRRVQYVPLGRALTQSADAKSKKALVHLLTPVQRASEACPWVKDLADGGDLFQPLAWTPNEAHRLLRDIPALEAAGLLVRVPNWWTRRPTRVQVGVSIGSKSQGRLGLGALLDFNVQLTVDGETISQDEWQALQQGTSGLRFIKGRWVEVDHEKLATALDHWKKVEDAAGEDGLSFLEGMRLLAGVNLGTDSAVALEDEAAAWSEVHAGAWLEAQLKELRDPSVRSLPGPELRATLRPYQEAGVSWLHFLTRLGLGACLADDMGLGKTVQVLALLCLRKKEKAGPTLLVVPASLLANWKAEAEKFAPHLVCRYAHPSRTPAVELTRAAADPKAFVEGADVVVTTFAMLHRQPWLGALDWGLAVLDEAQAIKNPAARQTRAVKQVKAKCRIALTGTPVENRLTDLWSIFDFTCPGLLGTVKVFGAFVKRLEERENGQYAALRRLVAPYILRRLKTDKSIIADLPEKVEVPAYCVLAKGQAVLYGQSVQELAEALKEKREGVARRGLVLAFLLRFKQICNHPAQWLGQGEYTPEASGKFQRLGELAEEIAARQEKVLVFSQFREMTQPLAAFLTGIFQRPGLLLHGGTAVANRQKIVAEFQGEGGPPFLVLSLKAGGTGLNLTAASHVIHFDRWWNPAVENQATDRAYRIGQKRNVMVHKFVCQGTVEEKIDALIRDKTKLAGEVLEGGVPSKITEMSDADLLALVRLDARSMTEE